MLVTASTKGLISVPQSVDIPQNGVLTFLDGPGGSSDGVIAIVLKSTVQGVKNVTMAFPVRDIIGPFMRVAYGQRAYNFCQMCEALRQTVPAGDLVTAYGEWETYAKANLHYAISTLASPINSSNISGLLIPALIASDGQLSVKLSGNFTPGALFCGAPVSGSGHAEFILNVPSSWATPTSSAANCDGTSQDPYNCKCGNYMCTPCSDSDWTYDMDNDTCTA